MRPSHGRKGLPPQQAANCLPPLSLHPSGLLPKDSRACCTLWSVFQDGSDAAIRTPTTSTRGVTQLPAGKRTGSVRRPTDARWLTRLPARREGPSPPTGPTDETGRKGPLPQRARDCIVSVSPQSPHFVSPHFWEISQTAGRWGCTLPAPEWGATSPGIRLQSRGGLPLAGPPQKCRVDDGKRPQTEFFRGPSTCRRRPVRLLLSLTGNRFSCIRFPPNGYAVFLTLFSKYFSPFPHGTCSLSVSCRYLALDGVYHPLWAAFPNNPTLRRQRQPGRAASRTGLSPSPTRLSRSTSTGPVLANAASPGHNSPTLCAGHFRLELFPLRSPLLGESWLVFFLRLLYA